MFRFEELIMKCSRVIVFSPAPGIVDFALKLIEKLSGSVVEPILATIRLKCSHQITDIFVRTAEAIINRVLPHELVRILAA